MAAGLGYRLDQKGAQFVSQLGQLVALQRAQIRGGFDLVEEGVGHQKVRSTMKSVSS